MPTLPTEYALHIMAETALACEDRVSPGVYDETARMNSLARHTANLSDPGICATTTNSESGAISLSSKFMEGDRVIRNRTGGVPPKLGWKSGNSRLSKWQKNLKTESYKEKKPGRNMNTSAKPKTSLTKGTTDKVLANSLHPEENRVPVICLDHASLLSDSSAKSGMPNSTPNKKSSTTKSANSLQQPRKCVPITELRNVLSVRNSSVKTALPKSTSKKKLSTTTLAGSSHPPITPASVLQLDHVSAVGDSSVRMVSGPKEVAAITNKGDRVKHLPAIPMPPCKNETAKKGTGKTKDGKFKKFCEICTVGHNGTYGSGRFCSSRCARTMGGLARITKKVAAKQSKEGCISKKPKKSNENKKEQRKQPKNRSWLNDMLENYVATHPEAKEAAKFVPKIVSCAVRDAAGTSQDYERVSGIRAAGNNAPGTSSSMTKKDVVGVVSKTGRSDSRLEVNNQHGGIPINSLLNPVFRRTN